MSCFKKLMDALAALEKFILVATMTIILILVFGNVLTRKLPFVTASWSFTEELVIALFVLISLLASALCCRENSHIALSVLSMRLDKAGQKSLRVLITAVSVVYCAVLATTGWTYMMAEYEGGVRTFVLHWPEWIFCAFVPVAAVCMILHLVEACLDFGDGNDNSEKEAA